MKKEESNCTILHITNDYSGSAVYKNLVHELDGLNISQIVYTPIKSVASIGINQIRFNSKDSKIIYSNILNKHYDRILYKLKVNKIRKNILSVINVSCIDLIHAHTWYSDGGVAYLLHKKYDIPYIVTIRNSDLNFFQKYLVHHRSFGRNILAHAKYVILISASSQKRLLNFNSLRMIKEELASKIRVIPNGVDPFWISQAVDLSHYKIRNTTFNILFIGRFLKGKNLIPLQKAILLLNKRSGSRHKLHIVGGGGSETKSVMKLIEKNPGTFVYHGKIYNKEKLLEVFKACDIFAMPSKYETFGLVYVEALLQGLPVLYTEGEGIDGFYHEEIGEKVKIFTPEEISSKLEDMMRKFAQFKIPISEIKENHDWSRVAQVYQKLYSNLTNE